MEKGSFQKSPFSRDPREFRDSRDSLDCGKQRRIRPFSRDSREFGDSRGSCSERTRFVMTPFSRSFFGRKLYQKKHWADFSCLSVEKHTGTEATINKWDRQTIFCSSALKVCRLYLAISVAFFRLLSTDLEGIRLRFCSAVCDFESRDLTAIPEAAKTIKSINAAETGLFHF